MQSTPATTKKIFLVVLYKTVPTESPTIQSIINFFSSVGKFYYDEFELIIWDNSPKSQNDSADLLRQSAPIKVIYISTPQNTSLSKIYNTASAELADNEYLTLLDQDSFLTAEYFIELRKAQLEYHPLILPKVICNGILVSPGTRFFSKGKLLKDAKPGLRTSKNLLAINSGMSALGSVFKAIRYDERLRFYGTDTYFMRHYEKYFSYACLINATINHSLAENESTTSTERKTQIAQARKAAWKIVFSETFSEKAFLIIYSYSLQLRDWLRKLR